MSVFPTLLMGAFPPLTASVLPTTAYGSKTGGGTVTTNSVTVYPTGGVSPYTYSWTYVSGDAVFTPTNATGVSTSWTCHVTTGDFFQAVWQIVVTGSLGSISPPVQVTVTAEETSFL